MAVRSHAETVARLGQNTVNFKAGRIGRKEWARRVDLILEDRWPGHLARAITRDRGMAERRAARAGAA